MFKTISFFLIPIVFIIILLIVQNSYSKNKKNQTQNNIQFIKNAIKYINEGNFLTYTGKYDKNQPMMKLINQQQLTMYEFNTLQEMPFKKFISLFLQQLQTVYDGQINKLVKVYYGKLTITQMQEEIRDSPHSFKIFMEIQHSGDLFTVQDFFPIYGYYIIGQCQKQFIVAPDYVVHLDLLKYGNNDRYNTGENYFNIFIQFLGQQGSIDYDLQKRGIFHYSEFIDKFINNQKIPFQLFVQTAIDVNFISVYSDKNHAEDSRPDMSFIKYAKNTPCRNLYNCAIKQYIRTIQQPILYYMNEHLKKLQKDPEFMQQIFNYAKKLPHMQIYYIDVENKENLQFLYQQIQNEKEEIILKHTHPDQQKVQILENPNNILMRQYRQNVMIHENYAGQKNYHQLENYLQTSFKKGYFQIQDSQYNFLLIQNKDQNIQSISKARNIVANYRLHSAQIIQYINDIINNVGNNMIVQTRDLLILIMDETNDNYTNLKQLNTLVENIISILQNLSNYVKTNNIQLKDNAYLNIYTIVQANMLSIFSLFIQYNPKYIQYSFQLDRQLQLGLAHFIIFSTFINTYNSLIISEKQYMIEFDQKIDNFFEFPEILHNDFEWFPLNLNLTSNNINIEISEENILTKSAYVNNTTFQEIYKYENEDFYTFDHNSGQYIIVNLLDEEQLAELKQQNRIVLNDFVYFVQYTNFCLKLSTNIVELTPQQKLANFEKYYDNTITLVNDKAIIIL